MIYSIQHVELSLALEKKKKALQFKPFKLKSIFYWHLCSPFGL